MKRIIAILLAMAAVFSLSACSEVPEFPQHPSESVSLSAGNTTEASQPTADPTETVVPSVTAPPPETTQDIPATTQPPATSQPQVQETVAQEVPAPVTVPPENQTSVKPTQKPSGESEAESQNPIVTQPQQEEAQSVMVWIPTKGGKKYHCKSTCSGMIDPQRVSINTAIAKGFTACKRCYQ